MVDPVGALTTGIPSLPAVSISTLSTSLNQTGNLTAILSITDYYNNTATANASFVINDDQNPS